MSGNRRLKLAKATLAALAAGMLAGPGPGQEVKPELTGPEKVVQEQVEAYNRHDVEAFLKTYSPDNKRYAFPDRETASGLDSMRATFTELFADNPDLKVKIAGRIVEGEYVIDHERVIRGGRETSTTIVAIYRVKGDKIVEVRFLR